MPRIPAERDSSLVEFGENKSKWTELLLQVRSLANDLAENLNVQFEKLATVRPDAIGYIVRLLRSSLSIIEREKASDPEIISHELRQVLVEIENRLANHAISVKKGKEGQEAELTTVFQYLLTSNGKVVMATPRTNALTYLANWPKSGQTRYKHILII